MRSMLKDVVAKMKAPWILIVVGVAALSLGSGLAVASSSAGQTSSNYNFWVCRFANNGQPLKYYISGTLGYSTLWGINRGANNWNSMPSGPPRTLVRTYRNDDTNRPHIFIEGSKMLDVRWGAAVYPDSCENGVWASNQVVMRYNRLYQSMHYQYNWTLSYWIWLGTHEFGHAYGLSHVNTPSSGCLVMERTLRPPCYMARLPAYGDRVGLIARYRSP